MNQNFDEKWVEQYLIPIFKSSKNEITFSGNAIIIFQS